VRIWARFSGLEWRTVLNILINFTVHKRFGISRLAVRLSASKEDATP
jgi:hypothetical protein